MSKYVLLIFQNKYKKVNSFEIKSKRNILILKQRYNNTYTKNKLNNCYFCMTT